MQRYDFQDTLERVCGSLLEIDIAVIDRLLGNTHRMEGQLTVLRAEQDELSLRLSCEMDTNSNLQFELEKARRDLEHLGMKSAEQEDSLAKVSD